jgi:error-prone DNA polymerase
MHFLLSAISNFSLLRGVHSPQTICRIAKELGFTAVALTDRNNLYGLPAFLRACNEYELQPFAGVELTAVDGEILLYAEGEVGFANLCRIISEKHCCKSFQLRTSISFDSRGIHAVSDNDRLLYNLQGKCNVYYRMRRPRTPPPEFHKCGIPAVIIPSMVFCNSNDYNVHRILRAIDCNTTLSRLSAEELFDERLTFESWGTVGERFEVFENALSATQHLAESLCSNSSFCNGKLIMPDFTGKTPVVELLRQKAFEGAVNRYGVLSDVVVKRLNYELDLIGRKGFSGYFLVVDDIVKQSPRTCGRGSGAASIVAYSLGITNVDPIRYNLMFERFLNPGRVDPPDIDVDFAWDERDAVLDYVFEKYGVKHAAMVATHQTCGARMAIREVARIYGLTETEISSITKRIPYFVDLPENGENIEDILRLWPAMSNAVFDPPWPDVLKDAGRIIGMPRGIGTHCGGVVITPMPISTIAPIQYSAKGYPIIQWEKDGAEEMGLVKIDLLGNRSLAVIRDAIANVKVENVGFSEKNWDPQSDPATIALLAKGETIGVFYVESPAMRLLQRKTKAGDFEHMVIHSSIIRPAANKYINEYVKRLHGKPYTVPHPSLSETLSETFGIMVYQEDVSKVAIALAGFTVEDADILRKIMSKKAKGSKFDDYKKKFYTGAQNRGVVGKVIDEVWEMMLSFCGYSFCKPHSASYVQVSFQSAYLKAHFPAAFMAAVISNYGGYYATQAYISEAQRLGLTIVPPDVNVSERCFFSKQSTVYVGFCQIKGLATKAQEQILSSRHSDGLFRSIDDLLSRTAIDEKDAEKLLVAGACDKLDSALNRSQQFWQMRRFYCTRSDGVTPELLPLTSQQYLQNQYQILGFLTACHPITLIKVNDFKGKIKAKDLQAHIGKVVTILGWCVTAKTVSTKFGDSMEFVTFEDETGIFETVFFPNIYKVSAPMLSRFTAFLVSGKVTEEFDVAILEAQRIIRP